jgi:putative membrane protein
VLGEIFNTHIYELSSLFMGLSVFALPLVVKEEKAVLKENYRNLFFAVLGIAVVVLITYLNPSGDEAGAVDIGVLSVGRAVYIFVVAMVAISAMVLPGISGSTLLLIFGLYVPVISAIKELLHFNFTYFWPIVIFGLGVVTGILTVIKLVKAGLEKHRSMMVYLILGLMIGALYAIAMGPTTLDVPQPAMTISTFHPLFFLLGGVILFALQKLKALSEASVTSA